MTRWIPTPAPSLSSSRAAASSSASLRLVVPGLVAKVVLGRELAALARAAPHGRHPRRRARRRHDHVAEGRDAGRRVGRDGRARRRGRLARDVARPDRLAPRRQRAVRQGRGDRRPPLRPPTRRRAHRRRPRYDARGRRDAQKSIPESSGIHLPARATASRHRSRSSGPVGSTRARGVHVVARSSTDPW